MYVIFPADEVVYLSYGRLIYVPKSQKSVYQTDTSSATTSTADQISDNRCSIPSVPSTSTSSSRSFRSITNGPTPSSYSEDLQQISVLRRGDLETLQGSIKSNKSWPQPSTSKTKNPLNNPPIRPRRSKKKNTSPSETVKEKLQDNNRSSKTLRLPLKCGNSKSPNSQRKLSYSDYVEVFTGEKSKATIEPLTKTSSVEANSVPTRSKGSRTPDNETEAKGGTAPNRNVKPTPKNQQTGQKPAKERQKNLAALNTERPPSIDKENTPVNSARDKNEFEYLPTNNNNKTSPTKRKELAANSDSKLHLSTTKQQVTPETTAPAKKNFFGNVRIKRTLEPTPKMAGMETPLRDLTHPSYNETLKAHNAVTFKLVRTVSDFTQQLGQIYEQHAEELQLLVSNFKKKNLELRKERPACPSSLFHTWETLLQEVEIDSQALGDVASILGRQISRPLLERSFFRKIQSRKVFGHRESYQTIVTKTEEKLAKSRQEYKTAYLAYLSTPTTESLSAYFNNHNAYVQQLHATNGMLDEYGKETLPQLLQEIDEIYTDLCNSVSEAILQEAEVVSARSSERQRRYESLISQCRAVSGTSDLAHLARSLPAPQGRGLVTKRPFIAPQPPAPETVDGVDTSELINDNIPPPLKDELVIDRLSAVQVQPAHDALKKESADLEAQIRQIHDSLETLLRIQQRSLESALFNKANELQEDISMKRFDLRVAQMHLSAIHSQKELFLNKLESADSGRERKMSSASTASMKNKWLKAFKSLKTPPPSASPKETEKKNGSAATRDIPRTDPDAHLFQEYTYKKITPCDICSQILRGHTRQGLKCRFCKMNVHVDCQEKAQKCQPKSRLLRRQKSTSEIESRAPETTVEEESVEDEAFSGMSTINRQLSFKDNTITKPPHEICIDRRRGYNDRVQGPTNADSTSMRRRLFAGMKSLTGFGSRSRHGSPSHRSISLPEKRNSQDASGTRPFGEPLCLLPEIENGNGRELPPTPPSPSPSKGKQNNKKGAKTKI